LNGKVSALFVCAVATTRAGPGLVSSMRSTATRSRGALLTESLSANDHGAAVLVDRTI